MPANEVKQRKKTQKQNEESSETNKCEDETKKVKVREEVCLDERNPSSPFSVDLRTAGCLVSLLVCLVLTWVVLQQNGKFAEVEEKYNLLYAKTASLLEMEADVLKVSQKCESVGVLLEGVGGQQGGLQALVEGLQQDVGQLKEWASGLAERRGQLQGSVASLTLAVGQIEERTSAITKDVTNKVASVRTDVRRMDGLATEVESLLSRVGELEEEASRVERSMIKRIADLLAGSIDRVADLRSASERNAQALEQLRRRVPELATTDKQLSERLKDLESGRARIIRTVTFAGDLKPKVGAIKRDFAMLEPQLADLTLRIGTLAHDLAKTEAEIAELRQTFAGLRVVEGDLGVMTKRLSQITEALDAGETLPQTNVTEALPQTHASPEGSPE